MPRISKPVGYRVVIIESERGWGSKVDEEIYFDNEAEAREYVREHNERSMPPLKPGESVPDCYWRAEYCGSV
jgi:hypothetical protein